jgi:hypothetical protein
MMMILQEEKLINRTLGENRDDGGGVGHNRRIRIRIPNADPDPDPDPALKT